MASCEPRVNQWVREFIAELGQLNEQQGSQILYHVTPTRNLARIMRDGLLPKIGPRARLIQEPVKGIYLFHSAQDAEEAVMNWLGDQFGEDTQLTLLAVQVPPGSAQVVGAGYETILTAVIPPQNIRVVTKDF